MHAESQRKCLLLGGTSHLVKAYQEEASLRGWELQHFSSMDDFGFLGRMREFDAAFVHDDLAPLSGLELAEYLEKLFQSFPMVLLTSQDRSVRQEDLPSNVVECVCSDEEPSGVFYRVEKALKARPRPRRESLVRRLAWFL